MIPDSRNVFLVYSPTTASHSMRHLSMNLFYSKFMIQMIKVVTATATSNATNYKVTVIIVKLSSLFIF